MPISSKPLRNNSISLSQTKKMGIWKLLGTVTQNTDWERVRTARGCISKPKASLKILFDIFDRHPLNTTGMWSDVSCHVWIFCYFHYFTLLQGKPTPPGCKQDSERVILRSLNDYQSLVWERVSVSPSMPKPSLSLHCESSSVPKHCLEDPVQLYSWLGCESWEASGIASDTVRLPIPTFSLRRRSD